MKHMVVLNKIIHYKPERLWIQLSGIGAIAIIVSQLIVSKSVAAIFLYTSILFGIVVYKYRSALPSALICLSLFSGRGVLLAGFGYWDVVAMLIVLAALLNMPFNKGYFIPFMESTY
jgi:hypothetical protein